MGEKDGPCPNQDDLFTGGSVFVSKPITPSGEQALGRTHYSYGFAARGFERLLESAGVGVVSLAHPEQFKSAAYARSIGVPVAGRPHLIFRSTEDIRLVKGAYNIACFAWEFDVLSGPRLGQASVLDEQTTMLKTCDEVWAPSRYTERVVRSHGVENVRCFPSPIFPPLTERPSDRSSWDRLSGVLSCELVSTSTNFLFGYQADIESDYQKLEDQYARPLGEQRRLIQTMANGGRIFTSVLNPYDKRKNLATLIDGFMMASAGREDMVLVLKLITSGVVEKPAGYLFHQLRLILGHPHCVHEDRIILIGGYLEDEEMSALYHGSDFYLCTSIAEGQNAPILEAMAHGCCPVSTRNTAMADYLDDGNSLPIREGRYSSLISGLAGDVAGARYSIDFCDRFAVAEAVETAMSLSSAEIEQKGRRAQSQALEQCGPATMRRRILTRLAEIDPARRHKRGISWGSGDALEEGWSRSGPR